MPSSNERMRKSKLDGLPDIQVPLVPNMCRVEACGASYTRPRWATGKNSEWILCDCMLSTDHEARWVKDPSGDCKWVGMEDFDNLSCHPSRQHSTIPHQSPPYSLRTYPHHSNICSHMDLYRIIQIYIYICIAKVCFLVIVVHLAKPCPTCLR
jgi:hypothetical protein